MKIFQAASFWWFSFTVMFFLALDFWSWEQPVNLSWLNLPSWVFYFVGLQTILALALILWARKFWSPLPRTKTTEPAVTGVPRSTPQDDTERR